MPKRLAPTKSVVSADGILRSPQSIKSSSLTAAGATGSLPNRNSAHTSKSGSLRDHTNLLSANDDRSERERHANARRETAVRRAQESLTPSQHRSAADSRSPFRSPKSSIVSSGVAGSASSSSTTTTTQSRRLSAGADQAGDSTRAPLVRLSNDQLADLYSRCIKLSAENRITIKNSWGLKLIDHITDLVDTQHDNFQVASCTLDASVKIFSCRVDSVHSEAYKVLGDLTRTGSARDDRDNSDALDDDGISADDDRRQRGDMAAAVRRRGQRGGFGSTGHTLETNPDNLNVKSFDLAFEIDPMFQRMSAMFDEGGASGLLLNVLPLSAHGQVVFDANPFSDLDICSQNRTAVSSGSTTPNAGSISSTGGAALSLALSAADGAREISTLSETLYADRDFLRNIRRATEIADQTLTCIANANSDAASKGSSSHAHRHHQSPDQQALLGLSSTALFQQILHLPIGATATLPDLSGGPNRPAPASNDAASSHVAAELAQLGEDERRRVARQEMELSVELAAADEESGGRNGPGNFGTAGPDDGEDAGLEGDAVLNIDIDGVLDSGDHDDDDDDSDDNGGDGDVHVHLGDTGGADSSGDVDMNASGEEPRRGSGAGLFFDAVDGLSANGSDHDAVLDELLRGSPIVVDNRRRSGTGFDDILMSNMDGDFDDGTTQQSMLETTTPGGTRHRRRVSMRVVADDILSSAVADGHSEAISTAFSARSSHAACDPSVSKSPYPRRRPSSAFSVAITPVRFAPDTRSSSERRRRYPLSMDDEAVTPDEPQQWGDEWNQWGKFGSATPAAATPSNRRRLSMGLLGAADSIPGSARRRGTHGYSVEFLLQMMASPGSLGSSVERRRTAGGHRHGANEHEHENDDDEIVLQEGRLPLQLESGGPGGSGTLFSYVDMGKLNQMASWAGPDHWKFRSAATSGSASSGATGTVGAGKRGGQSSKAAGKGKKSAARGSNFVVDFERVVRSERKRRVALAKINGRSVSKTGGRSDGMETDENEDEDASDTFSDVEELDRHLFEKSVRASTQLSLSVLEKQSASLTTLPADQQYRVHDLMTLFLRPQWNWVERLDSAVAENFSRSGASSRAAENATGSVLSSLNADRASSMLTGAEGPDWYRYDNANDIANYCPTDSTADPDAVGAAKDGSSGDGIASSDEHRQRGVRFDTDVKSGDGDGDSGANGKDGGFHGHMDDGDDDDDDMNGCGPDLGDFGELGAHIMEAGSDNQSLLLDVRPTDEFDPSFSAVVGELLQNPSSSSGSGSSSSSSSSSTATSSAGSLTGSSGSGNSLSATDAFLLGGGGLSADTNLDFGSGSGGAGGVGGVEGSAGAAGSHHRTGLADVLSVANASTAAVGTVGGLSYARMPKQIDVRLLKTAVWKSLCQTDMSSSVTADEWTEGTRSFSDVLRELPQRLPPSQASQLSVPFAFMCLLHMANEKSLAIHGQPDMSELRIDPPFSGGKSD